MGYSVLNSIVWMCSLHQFSLANFLSRDTKLVLGVIFYFYFM
jgi:hypothetical protein